MDALLAFFEVYNLPASLTVLFGSIAVVVLGKKLLLMIPAFAQTKGYNHGENRVKYKTKKGYVEKIKSSQKVALLTNVFLFLAVLPFITTFTMQPIWKIALHVVAILMIYDFFYYLMHRFLFHGPGWFRKVHGVHHKARTVTSLDSLYMHPMEAFLGIALFIVSILGFSLAVGEPLHVITLIITTVIYTQLNTLNHVHVDLPYAPFKLITWISKKHAIHHIDMQRGNYATITLLYDKLFGTLE